MCQQHQATPAGDEGRRRADQATHGGEPFPWDAGVFDAHCHPTDTMSSIARIAEMQARALTIMATRSQDQDLVLSVAREHGIQGPSDLFPSGETESGRKVVPAFGWHPWFSHQLYDDVSLPHGAEGTTFNPHSDAGLEEKAKHYGAVLSGPQLDIDFITALPEPKSLSSWIQETRERLLACPLALVGEVGVDKAFRLPQAWKDKPQSEQDDGLTPGGREGRLLSPHQVRMPHQVSVLLAQLRLAGELGRAVSVHGVQAHGVLFDAVSALWKGHEKEVISNRQRKRVAVGAEDFSSDEEDEDDGTSGIRTVKPKPFPPRICLHSFSAPAQMMKQWLNPAIPSRIFFSFSEVVNLSTPATENKFSEVIRACPDDRILIESDIHVAGAEMDRLLEDMYRRVCQIKGWGLREGVERIRKNYQEFVLG